MSDIPANRVQLANQARIWADREFVLYWMIAFRRTTYNFALQRAVEWCVELNKPLVVFEPLRIGYRWASDRLHRFVIDGMADNARRLARRGVLYYPYVEPAADADKGLLAALASQACIVVTDEFPGFFLPRMVRSAAQKLDVRVQQVDSNGLLPLRSADQVFSTAYSFRAFLQKNLPVHLRRFPKRDPLARLKLPAMRELPPRIIRRWSPASEGLLAGDRVLLARLAIDHSVPTVTTRGGSTAAKKQLDDFLAHKLSRYVRMGNHPDDDCRSGLSPYLHFGHIAPHEIFHELMKQVGWSIEKLSGRRGGKRSGWWNAGENAEAWLDELITWRELSYNMSFHHEDYDRYESLPDWARGTLAKHARDRRATIYGLDQFAAARTHDPVWNAAQTQLVEEGRIHNYLRMLWGKKILEWSASPQEAANIMIELNNRFALDGRDPNSYSGIFWVLGRYDRPWGPERPIYGNVRYMSSENTLRKLRMKQYLERYTRGASEIR